MSLDEGLAAVGGALRAHAGGLELVSVDGDAATVRFTGACTGCPGRALTLTATVAPMLAEHGVTEVTAQGVRLDPDHLARLRTWLTPIDPGHSLAPRRDPQPPWMNNNEAKARKEEIMRPRPSKRRSA